MKKIIPFIACLLLGFSALAQPGMPEPENVVFT